MPVRPQRRVLRAAAALLAGGSVVLVTGAAHAAGGPGLPLSAAGNTASTAVSVALHLPAPGDLQLSLLDQTGSLQHQPGAPDVATSVSTLGGGPLFAAGGPLAAANQTVRADLDHPSAASSPALTVPAQLATVLHAGVPALSVRSARDPLATTGNSSVAELSLGRLADLLPAGSLDALTRALSQLVGTAASPGSGAAAAPANTAQGALGGVLASVDATLKQQSGVDPGTRQALTTLRGTLGALQADLPQVVGALSGASVVDLRGLSTTHSVQQSPAVQQSTVRTTLTSLSLLGGFVSLSGFDNAVTTRAGGVAGSAQTILQPNVARVSVGYRNELSALLGPGGLQLSGLPAALPAPVATALNTLQDRLNALLNVAGVQIQPDAVTANTAAKDGTSATGALSGLRILVAPALPAAPGSSGQPAAPLAAVTVGAIRASSAARQLPAAAPAAPATPLAYTGADLPASGAVATVLVGLGVLAARRRRYPRS